MVLFFNPQNYKFFSLTPLFCFYFSSAFIFFAILQAVFTFLEV